MYNNTRWFGDVKLYTSRVLNNCYKCHKYISEDDSTCEVNLDLIAAYLTHGRVSESIATRMGWLEVTPYSTPCIEIDPEVS